MFMSTFINNQKWNKKSVQHTSFYHFQINLLLGRNGQGKTLLLNIASMQDDNFTGEIFYENENIKNCKEWKNIFFLPTDFNFPVFLTSYKFIKIYLKLFSTKIFGKFEIENKFKEFGLFECINKNPNKLSSGQKRTLLFLLINMIEPKVLLLDEPEANLDPYARNQLYQRLQALKQKGVSIILASHVIDSNNEIIDYITILNEKEIVFESKINSVKESSSIYENFNKEIYDKI
ncbi:ABC transporter ATP-binding protein [Mycoplasmopsis fermentans M64]|nr:ABC transporter ATP-binding protein [Mycoplasmopsis fermentans M64]